MKPTRVRTWRPIITFSRTLRLPKSRMFWNVRATPSRAIACAGRPASSLPSKRIEPPSARYSAEMTLSVVVFPEPLGPISAWMSPARTVMLSALTAVTPPKRFHQAANLE